MTEAVLDIKQWGNSLGVRLPAAVARAAHLHPLKGTRKGQWAMTVSGNWRITFAFDGDDVIIVNLEDYH